jgi:hypothetical protein
MYSPSATGVEEGTVQVVKRGQTNSVVESYLLGRLPGETFNVNLFLDGSTRLASGYWDKKLSGLYDDVAILPESGDSVGNPQIVSTGFPPTYGLKAINTFGQDVGRYALLWREQVGLGTLENRIFGYRIGSDLVSTASNPTKSAAVPLLTSQKGSYFWGATIDYKPTAPKSAGTLVTFEKRYDASAGAAIDTLVKFDLGVAKLASSRKALFTSKSSAYVDSIDYGFGLGCLLSSDPTVGKGSSLTVVDIATGAKLPIADERAGSIGLCRVPQSGFVTYLQASLLEGIKLVGYDIKTGKSGAIVLPVGLFLRSITTTGDGNLSWKEDYGAGTRLIEFDVNSFRSGINNGTVPKL